MHGQAGSGDASAHARDQTVAAGVEHAFDRGRAVAEVKRGGAEIDATGGVGVDRDEAAAEDVDLAAGEGRLVVAGIGLHAERMHVDRARERGIGGAADEVRYRGRRQAGEEGGPGGGVAGGELAGEGGILDAERGGVGQEAVARRIQHPHRQEAAGVEHREPVRQEELLPLQVDTAEFVGVLAHGEGRLADARHARGGQDDLAVGAGTFEVDAGTLRDGDGADFLAVDAAVGRNKREPRAVKQEGRRVAPLVLLLRGRKIGGVETARERRVGDVVVVIDTQAGTGVQVDGVDLDAGVVREASGAAGVQAAVDMEDGGRQVAVELEEVLRAAGFAVTEDRGRAGPGLVAVKTDVGHAVAQGEAVLELGDADLQRGRA